jgi:predicted flavoprotein YhiN
LSENIKKFRLKISDLGTLDAAISSVGGVALNAIDAHFQLHQIPNQFCMGEMLNWDAPTGGYLLQGCASNGVFLAKYFNKIE